MRVCGRVGTNEKIKILIICVEWIGYKHNYHGGNGCKDWSARMIKG